MRVQCGARGLVTLAFWSGVLLAVPNCTLDRSGIVAPQNLDRGPFPWTGAVFCDIEKPVRQCATDLTPAELASSIRLSEAAVALAEGRTSSIGLDESPEARARCGGEPEAVFFEGPFPQGLPVCLSCSVIGTTHADANSVCRNRCYDFYGETLEEGSLVPAVPPSGAVQAFCDARTRVSTNASVTTCLDGSCEGGTLSPTFVDERLNSEVVIWTNLIGVTAPGSTLTRTAAFTDAFDAGAASSQWFTRGDGFVEFSVDNVTQALVLGLSEIPAACAPPCDDTDPTRGDLHFALAMGTDGRVYVQVRDAIVPGPDIDGSFGTYSPGERFRVRLQDNGDGTATVSFSRTIGSCLPGSVCPQVVLHSVTTTAASYPLRVDATIRDTGAAFTDVRVVRIR